MAHPMNITQLADELKKRLFNQLPAASVQPPPGPPPIQNPGWSNVGKIPTGNPNAGLFNNYFNPTSNNGQNFWSTPLAKGLGKVQQGTESFANKPKVQIAPQITNPALRFILGLPEGIINAPQTSIQGATEFGTNIRQGTLTPQNTLASLAKMAELPLTVATFGGGSQVAKQIGKQTLKKILISGAKGGAKYGAGFGTLGGLEGLTNEDTLLSGVGKVATGAITGAGTGALFGAGMAGLGHGVNEIAKRLPKASDVPVGLSVKKLTKKEHDANVAKAGLSRENLPIKLNNLLRNIDERGTTKQEFLQAWTKEINNPDMAARANIQPLAAYMKRTMKMTPEQFFDNYANKSGSNVSQAGLYDAKMNQRAIKEYGLTDVPESIGYITREGKGIDSSGIKQGSNMQGRNLDHREIAQVGVGDKTFNSGTEAMNHFIDNTGNIRVVGAKGELNVEVPIREGMPSTAQLNKIKQLAEGKTIFYDISNGRGGYVKSGNGTYDNFLNELKKAIQNEKDIKIGAATGQIPKQMSKLEKLVLESPTLEDLQSKWTSDEMSSALNQAFGGNKLYSDYGFNGLADFYNKVKLNSPTLNVAKPNSKLVAQQPSSLGTNKAGLYDTSIVQEANKFNNAGDFYQRASSKVRDQLREQGIRGPSGFEKVWNDIGVKPKQQVLDSLNPTGGLYVDYTPQERMKMPLGENITTLDKTLGKSPNETITIYRGVSRDFKQKGINPGDFITTNPELAKTYAGDGNVISKKVKLSDVLDDKGEPLGGEYIYRPNIPQQPLSAPSVSGGGSVEGFIKNTDLTISEKPSTLFRGEAGDNVQAQNLVTGRHFADTLQTAQEFAPIGHIRNATTGLLESNKVTSEFRLSPNAKIANLDKVKEFLSQTQQLGNKEDITTYLKANGYDGAMGTLPGKGNEVIIINPKVVKELTPPPKGVEVKPDKFVEEMNAMAKNRKPIVDQPKKVIPELSNQEGQVKLTESIMRDEEGAFKGVFNKWIGQRDVAKTTGAEAGMKFREIPKTEATEFINHAEGVKPSKNPEIIAKATEWKQKTDMLYQDLQATAKKEGVDLGYIDQYVTHFWKESPQQVRQMMSAKGKGFGSRTVPTYKEGLELGLTPKYSNPAEIMSEYVAKIEKTKANIGLFTEMKDRGMIVPASIGRKTPGFSPVNAPGFPRSTTSYEGKVFDGSYYAPDNIAKEINRIFSPEDFGKLGKGFSISAKISKGTQDIVLSGGVPATPINAFTLAQVTKEFTSGSFVRPIKAFVKSLSPEASLKYFEKNAGQIKKMQARNVTVRSSFDTQGLKGGGNLWDKIISDATFKRFMPSLQIELFNNVEKRALGRGMGANEAADVAAKAVQNFYGLTNTGTMAGRSQLGKDITSTIAFAPTYRESMINFWVKSVKALRHPLALENSQNIKFLVGAAATYGVMDALNRKLNGHPMSQNPTGKEDKLLIPIGDTTIGVPFLSSIATVPRGIYRIAKDVLGLDFKAAGADTLRTFGSMLIKPAGEMILNEDYFGQEIYDQNATPLEKGKQIAMYLFKSNQHPYIKAALEAKGTPIYQTLSKAAELPFRFYKTSSIANAPFWDNYFKTKALDEQFQEMKYTDPDKAVTFYNENKAQLDSLASLKDQIGAYYETGQDSKVLQAGGVVQADGHMAFKGTDGKFHLIDTNFDVPLPVYTGNALLDKKIKSSYTSKLSSLGTNVVTLFENGIITAEQAEDALQGLANLKTSAGGGKKPAKITVAKTTVKLPKFSTTKSKFKPLSVKIPKMPTFKMAKAKTTKITAGKSKVTRIKLGTFKNTLTQGFTKLA
jgi:hypothetical protein